MDDLEFTDRYKALGIPYPDPKTMCHGECEGTGFVPIHADEARADYLARWHEAEGIHHEDDGWHFVRCVVCEGSGKAKEVG